jgi:hypothetical protein
MMQSFDRDASYFRKLVNSVNFGQDFYVKILKPDPRFESSANPKIFQTLKERRYGDAIRVSAPQTHGIHL